MEYDDDKERLIRLSSGDHEAFRILFTRYQPGLKKYIAFIIKSDVAAEDIVQDIFIKIWILRKQMKAINSFRALFSFTIAIGSIKRVEPVED